MDISSWWERSQENRKISLKRAEQIAVKCASYLHIKSCKIFPYFSSGRDLVTINFDIKNHKCQYEYNLSRALRAFRIRTFVVHSQLLAYIIWTSEVKYVGERNILAREYSLGKWGEWPIFEGKHYVVWSLASDQSNTYTCMKTKHLNIFSSFSSIFPFFPQPFFALSLCFFHGWILSRFLGSNVFVHG